MDQIKKEKRQFWVILVIVFLGFLGISIPYLIFPALFLNPEYSILPISYTEPMRALFLGVTLAVYPLGQFIGSPILGSLSDDYGRKPLLVLSLILSAIANLLTGFAIAWSHLGMLIVCRFIAGLMEGNIAIARAMGADLTTISKHKTFGKINGASSIAYLIGPLLGGLMTDKSIWEHLTTSTPFYFICIFFFGLAGLSSFLLEKSATNLLLEARSFWSRINLIKRMSVLFSNRRLQFLMITSTALTLAIDIFYEFGPVYLTVKWTLGPAKLALYNSALCLALAIGNGWLPTFFSSRISNRIAIISSISGLILTLIGVVLTNSPLLMVLLFTLSGLVIGVAVTLLTVKISNSAPTTIQGEVMGVQVSLRVLGDGLICLLGGALLLISPKLILIIAALIALATIAYYINLSTLHNSRSK